MNILKTTRITVSGVYEDDTSFGRLFISALCKTLSKNGFTCDASEDYSSADILWNGAKRLCLSAASSTSNVSVRIALPFGSTSNWGSTHTLGTINSGSTATQSFSYDVSFFAVGDVTYIVISLVATIGKLGPYISFPAYSLAGEKTIVGAQLANNSSNGLFYSALVVPLSETTMDNNWEVEESPGTYHPSEPSACVMNNFVTIAHNELVDYIAKDIYSIAMSASCSLGQVITIDGEQYVFIDKTAFAKIQTA